MSNLNWAVWRHKSMADISPKYSSNHEELSAEEVPKVVLIEAASDKRTQRTFEKYEINQWCNTNCTPNISYDLTDA